MHVQLCRVHRLRWSHDTRRRYSSRHFLNHSTTTIPGWRATGRSGTHDVIVNTSQHAIHFLWMCKHAMHCCLVCARRTYLLQHNSGIDPQALSRTPREEQLLTRHPKTSNPSWVILSRSHQLHCFRHAETSTAYFITPRKSLAKSSIACFSCNRTLSRPFSRLLNSHSVRCGFVPLSARRCAL